MTSRRMVSKSPILMSRPGTVSRATRAAAYVVAGVSLALPATVRAQDTTGAAEPPPPDYRPFERAADVYSYPAWVELSPDGAWVAYWTPRQGITVAAASGEVSSTLPLLNNASCRAMWQPAATLLALTCLGDTARVYLWSPETNRLTVVSKTVGQRGFSSLHWLPTGRLLYTTNEAVPPPAAASARPAAAVPLARRAPNATEPAACRTPGLAESSAAVLCADSIEIFRSIGHESAARAPASRAENQLALTRVWLADPRRGTRTLATTIRDRATGVGHAVDLMPTANGRQMMVSVDAGSKRLEGPWTGGILDRQPFRRLYRVPLRDARQVSAPFVFDLTGDAPPTGMGIAVLAESAPFSHYGAGPAVSPDGRVVAWRSRNKRASDVDMRAVDTVYLAPVVPESKPLAVLLDARDTAGDSIRLMPSSYSYQPPIWTPDGQRVLAIAHGHLWSVEARTAQPRRLSDGLGRIVDSLLWRSSHDALVTTFDPLTGRSGLWWVDLATGRWQVGDEAQQAARTVAVAKHGPGRTATIAYAASTLRSPANIFVLRLGRNGRPRAAPRQLTTAIVSVPLPAVQDTVLTYRIGTERLGTAVLLRPAGSTGPVPAIIMGYPGAADVSRGAHTFAAGGNYLLDKLGAVVRGYAVLTLSIPMAAHGDYGTAGPAADILQAVTAGLDAAVRTGWVDSACLGVIGHSYGGYMVNLLVTHTQRFRAAVSVSGPSDFVSGWVGGGRSGPGWYARSQGRMGKSLLEAPERYVRNSPILHLDSATTPLLLIHGALDQQVHVSQSDEMFRGLAQRGTVVEYVRYRRAGHEPPEEVSARALDWFDRFLMNCSEAESETGRTDVRRLDGQR